MQTAEIVKKMLNRSKSLDFALEKVYNSNW